MSDEQRFGFRSQVRAIKVEPRKATKQNVPEGFWSLSSLSTVPYVRFTGPGGFQKEFSWGEIVEVPKGCEATLENASYHVGDIVLNGGRDYSTCPARITVPVFLRELFLSGNIPKLTPLPPGFPDPSDFPIAIAPSWPVDVRRARRAYLAIDWRTDNKPDGETIIPAEDLTFDIYGFAEQRSHDTGNSVPIPSGRPGVGYSSHCVMVAGTEFGIIPLGYSACNGDCCEAMALLDYADFIVKIDADFLVEFNPSAYYILEY